MKATRMTSKESGVSLSSRSCTDPDDRFLFPDMPKPIKPVRENALVTKRAFLAASIDHGGMFRPVDAAKVLGIAYGTLAGYMDQANPPVDVFEFFGVRWVSGDSIDARINKVKLRGRPKRVTA
uniref:Uncharacterized protein n=1 Tax=uncultured prokaryote TaxID=198431 RepID=A0A0H5Q726_9ZZZZ|nr:hypothetical protein [uncultured prokaryote]